MTDAPREGWYWAAREDGVQQPVEVQTHPGHEPIFRIAGVRSYIGAMPDDWTLGPRIDDLLADATRYREALEQIKSKIFYFMIRNVDQKGSKSYTLLGEIKERLVEFLRDAELAREKAQEGGS